MTTNEELKIYKRDLHNCFKDNQKLMQQLVKEKEKHEAEINKLKEHLKLETEAGDILREELNKKDDEIKQILEFENPYPKDIFCWDNKEKLNFNRGRFNRHCWEIVENIREDLKKHLRGVK